MKNRFSIVCCAALFFATPAFADKAQHPLVAAGSAVSCEVSSILATEEKGGIDSRLKSLKKQLAKPPFSAFKTMKLLASRKLIVPKGGKKATTLPSGKILTLSFKEKLLEKKDDVRLRMHLSIAPPKSKKFLPGTVFTIVDGGTLLVAGDKHKGGTLVVGITCTS